MTTAPLPPPPHPRRLPTTSDFPPSLTLDIIPPPTGHLPLNILLLLHGLGDTQTPFTALARSLSLPSTVCISLRAPSPIPPLFTGSEAPSFHWGDDLLVDSRTGEIEVDAGFEKALKMVRGVVIGEVLVGKCGWREGEVFLLGFGQGAMVALGVVVAAAAAAVVEGKREGRGRAFGGVVAVGGGVPGLMKGRGEGEMVGKAKTPVILLGGSRSRVVTKEVVRRVKEVVEEVEYVRWEKREDGMPANREEMLPIMRFLARRLKSREGVPEGAVELADEVKVSLVGG